MNLSEKLTEAGIETKRFQFSGNFSNEKTDFPEQVGEYDTVRYGGLADFTEGQPEADGWKRVWLVRQKGCACEPASLSAVYVPAADYPAAVEIAKSYAVYERRWPERFPGLYSFSSDGCVLRIPKHEGSCA